MSHLLLIAALYLRSSDWSPRSTQCSFLFLQPLDFPLQLLNQLLHPGVLLAQLVDVRTSPTTLSLPERHRGYFLTPYSKGKWRRKHRRNKRKLSAEILGDYDTVAVAKLDVDDRGVLI